MKEALTIGLSVALPVALAVGAVGWAFSDQLSGGRIAPWTFVIAAAAGWVGVIPLLVSNFWLGQQRRGAMLAMAAVQALAVLTASLAAPGTAVLEWVAVIRSSPALVLLLLPKAQAARAQSRPHPMRRYILPGLSIGVLSPLSLLLVRSTVGEALSWHDAGVLQALFRVADWVCTLAGGYLAVLPAAPCRRTLGAAAGSRNA